VCNCYVCRIGYYFIFVARIKKFQRHQKAQFQSSADRTHFSAAVCIDASGHRYKSHFCTMGDVDVIIPPGTGREYFMRVLCVVVC